MSDYLIVIKIPIQALDDPDARNKTNEMLKDIKIPGSEVKLQRLVKDKAPIGISLKV